ncbi:hypothetical protein SCHPADRAFT_839192 [Schizopora paradoxa]|uniref:Uncharacterized protein n=1 Tax=Schizopora paradoxa TaxID=27342 RepID=A0A0H2R7W3_9AGAM|nr:hypothetical protein SCHPADRAFT_839192 [Schizopora paradoxa]
MHNLFLGLFKHHCLVLWRMDIKSGEKKPKVKPHTETEQKEMLKKGREAIAKGGDKLRGVLKSLRKGYLESLVRVNQIDLTGCRDTKEGLTEAILRWVRLSFQVVEVVAQTVPPLGDGLLDGTTRIKKPSVLGHEVLSELHKDMKNTILPSWLESPPRNLGNSSHGKLKADQWRTSCSVSLVITLIRLWAGDPKTQPMLDNFIHLVTAVKIATSRSTSESRITSYDNHIKDYVTGMVALYGSDSLRSNHHIAFHVSDDLRWFGPSPLFWAFPFERLIGKIQKIPTNKRLRTTPLTFMQTFCRGANLMGDISSFTDETLPGLYRLKLIATKWFTGRFLKKDSAVDVFADVEDMADLSDIDVPGLETREILIPEFDDKTAKVLEDADYALLVSAIQHTPTPGYEYVSKMAASTVNGHRVVNLVNHKKDTVIRGYKFSPVIPTPVVKRSKNGFIRFRSISGELAAGRITDIFVHRRLDATETFVKVDRYAGLDGEDLTKDPFTKYPELDAQLYYRNPRSTIIIREENIISHIAYCPVVFSHTVFKEDVFVGLSLARVSYLNSASVQILNDFIKD